ncbi:MAG: polymerase delta prime subunit [Proteobacteria bacterium]|nr:polymerase delta prime subunit [Pseudomonadota bacterium]
MNPIQLHNQVWNALQARRARLPHALLMAGPRGLGKLDLARAFVASLLCEQPQADGQACGQCLACGWQAQGNHPDFRLLQPEALSDSDSESEDSKKKPSKEIKIDQVRALDEFLTVGTHRAGMRIVLIHPAEAMNHNTANSILKSLEEPSADTLFLLISNEPARLLPTIRSRCQFVPLNVPSRQQSIAMLQAAGVADPEPWLALAGGAPMQALELAQSEQKNWPLELARWFLAGDKLDALTAAAAVDKLLKDSKGQIGLRQLIEWSLKWAFDLLLARKRLPVRYFVQHRATITTVAAAVPEIRLLHFYRRLLVCRREVEQPLNSRLFLDEFFLNYRALFAN